MDSPEEAAFYSSSRDCQGLPAGRQGEKSESDSVFGARLALSEAEG
jgi:hypothetical protein